MRTALIVVVLIVVLIFIIQNTHAVNINSWVRTCSCRSPWPVARRHRGRP